jgi:SH3 domain protein
MMLSLALMINRVFRDMNRWSVLLMVLCGIFVASPYCLAEDAFVTDTLQITFRTGPSLENKIISVIASGQAVEVLGTEGEWTHIQLLKDGEPINEGWVMSRYLITRQPWEMQARACYKESREYKEEAADLEKELGEAVHRGQQLDVALKDTAVALEDLKKKHESLKEGAAGYLELKTAYTATQSELDITQQALGELTEKYEDLRGSEDRRWFGTGAGILLLGLVFGMVLGRQQRKRHTYY